MGVAVLKREVHTGFIEKVKIEQRLEKVQGDTYGESREEHSKHSKQPAGKVGVGQVSRGTARCPVNLERVG